MDADFEKTPIVSCVHAQSLEPLKRSLAESGYQVFELNGETIDGRESFFAEAARCLPMDPPLRSKDNWDALADSLWGGLDQLSQSHVAIIWTDPGRMAEHSMCDFLMAATCLQRVAGGVADAKSGISTLMKMLIFMVGNGPGYRTLLGCGT